MGLFSSLSAKSWREKLGGFFSKGSTLIDIPALEELLLESDLSFSHVENLVAAVKTQKPESQEAALSILETELVAIAQKVNHPQPFLPSPACILLLGVNGSGKTTTAARLAYFYKQQGINVILAAGDTFRAGAVDQLKLWAQRANVPCVAQGQGADAAAVAYDAWERAKRENALLIIDTAGRMQNKGPLMEQLHKLVRIISRDGQGAPHQSWLVIDGNTGQNALSQAKEFNEVVPLNGLIVTKLDGTARGGAALSGAVELNIPLRFVGVGEKMEDLRAFNLKEYVQTLLRGE